MKTRLPFLLILLSFQIAQAQSEKEFADMRNSMVVSEVEAAGVQNPDVLAAMRATPRHRFVPQKLRSQAYLERALPIGHGQTISSPFTVASMTEALDPQPGDNVLEIGTGSGYQAAVLSPLVKSVYTIEIVEPLARSAKKVLKQLKYTNVNVRAGDGYKGWPEAAPFDKIIVTCSPESPPPALVEQLRDGGLMVIPLGERYAQNLCILKKRGKRLVTQPIRPILFVPMTGAAEDRREILPDPQNPELLNGDFEQCMRGKRSNLESSTTLTHDEEFTSPGEVEEEKAKAAAKGEGEFDEILPKVWCYLRQARIDASEEGQSAKYCIRFSSKKLGEPSQICQGVGVDGRTVTALQFTMRIRGESLLPDFANKGMPGVYVIFIDDERNTIRSSVVGGWRGTFDWRTVRVTVTVPESAREACIYFGLHGARGTLWLDDVEMVGIQ